MKTTLSRILGILMLGGCFFLVVVIAAAYIVGNRPAEIQLGGQTVTIEGNETYYVIKSEGEIIVLDREQNVTLQRVPLKKDGEFYYLEITGAHNVIQNVPTSTEIERAVIEKVSDDFFKVYFSVDGTYKITVY